MELPQLAVQRLQLLDALLEPLMVPAAWGGGLGASRQRTIGGGGMGTPEDSAEGAVGVSHQRTISGGGAEHRLRPDSVRAADTSDCLRRVQCSAKEQGRGSQLITKNTQNLCLHLRCTVHKRKI